ncbi:hypothetical protein EDC01DRAFT_217235 [Geopyxis carbonaria]|nr:hypothetical protein EDC01DRAFT_217235 [Geopyxis carbonaria]
MASIPKTRARAPTAPVAAPHDEPSSLPSPHDSEEGSNQILTRGNVNGPPGLISDEVRLRLNHRTQEAILKYSNPMHNVRAVVDNQLQIFRQEVMEELNTWRAEFLSAVGQPLKRPPDDDLIYYSGSPEGKKIKSDQEDDDEEEEGGVKNTGGWRCLYYEEDPRTYAQCGEKRYKRVSELRRHIKTHTLPHHCQKCGYRTAEERRLTTHKCEDANKKRYSPVTPEDRKKHEQLARMGIKVGQMKVILFGSAEEKRPESFESSALGDDESDQLRQTYQSNSHSLSQAQQTDFVPSNYPGFTPHMHTSPHMPVHTSPPMVHGLIQPPVPPTFLNDNLIQQQMVQPPFVQFHNIPIHHSPTTGLASNYYSAPCDPPLYPAPQSPITPDGRMNNQVPAPLSVGTSPGSNQMSPQQQYSYYAPSGVDASMPMNPSYTRTRTSESLDNFLSSTFPEMHDMRRGANVSEPEYCVTRRMPDSEIQAMERNLASRSLGPDGLPTTSDDSPSVKPGFLIRFRQGADRSKKLFRSLSGRDTPLQSVEEVSPQAEASSSEVPVKTVQTPVEDPRSLSSTQSQKSEEGKEQTSQKGSLWKRLSLKKSGAPPGTTVTTTRATTLSQSTTASTKRSIWSSITSIFIRNNQQSSPAAISESAPASSAPIAASA